MKSFLSEGVLINKELLQQGNVLNALGDGLNASVFHSVSADRESFEIGCSFESFGNLSGSESAQTAVVNKQDFEGVGLLQIME